MYRTLIKSDTSVYHSIWRVVEYQPKLQRLNLAGIEGSCLEPAGLRIGMAEG